MKCRTIWIYYFQNSNVLFFQYLSPIYLYSLPHLNSTLFLCEIHSLISIHKSCFFYSYLPALTTGSIWLRISLILILGCNWREYYKKFFNLWYCTCMYGLYILLEHQHPLALILFTSLLCFTFLQLLFQRFTTLKSSLSLILSHSSLCWQGILLHRENKGHYISMLIYSSI